jgi:hypothetical protein
MTVHFAMRHFKKLRALLRIDEHLSVLTVQWISRSDFKLLTDIISQATILGGPHTNTNDQNQLEPLYIHALETGCHYVYDVVLSTLHAQLQDGEIPVDFPCYNTCYTISRGKDWEAIHFWSDVIASRFAVSDPAADPSEIHERMSGLHDCMTIAILVQCLGLHFVHAMITTSFLSLVHTRRHKVF